MTEMLRMQGKVGDVSWTVKLPEISAANLFVHIVEPLAGAYTRTHDRVHPAQAAHTDVRDYRNNITSILEIAKAISCSFHNGRKETEANSESPSGPETNGNNLVVDATRQVLDHYAAEWFERPASMKATDSRINLVRRMMRKGYSADELMNAISGYRYLPHYHGDNDRFSKYRGLKVLIGDDDKIDRGLEAFNNPPGERIELDDNKAIDELMGSLGDSELVAEAMKLLPVWSEVFNLRTPCAYRFGFWKPMVDLSKQYPATVLTSAVRTATERRIPKFSFIAGQAVNLLKLSDKPARDLSEADKKLIAEQKRIDAYAKIGMTPPPLPATG